ncbi:Retrovirus-related Pol polyprotein from transposon TNT 1-94 [Cucumis melo var. makuwa]|uniref:Retrovirus-related Pol polyprotein from transposon TNT 1-94 n=1 Tax=Cucumis melo var. makuwa TaxID=1194695 RepID=A0A5A7VGH5_CUCMM|nr:Retrovirus-related Pol polyprotein from transposon TNT 1-94 [Cucumis melo var. makuwa]
MDMDEMVYSTIPLYLSDEVLRLVDEATTTGELCKKLESLYLTKSLQNKLYLKEKFFGYKMDQSKSLEENLDEFQKIIVDLNNIVLDALKTLNLDIEKECKDGELLMARGRRHFKKNCPLNMSKEALSSKQAVETSEVNVIDGYNLAQITDGYDLVETTDWYESVEKSDEGKVLLGDNGTCDAKETSSIEIATHDRMIRMLTNVSYVVELKRNIISLGELDRSGCTIKFENGVMKVTKCSLVKLRETLRHGLYVLEGTTVSGTVTIVSGKVTDMCMLLHKRLAYVSERGLQALSQQGLLGGVKDVELPLCELV